MAFELGQVFDPDAREPLNMQWDPRTPSDGYVEPSDLGWVGEDASGVWMCVEPTAALATMPELWDPVARWQAGQRTLTERDWDELSAFEYEAKLTLAVADDREQRRRMQPGNEED